MRAAGPPKPKRGANPCEVEWADDEQAEGSHSDANAAAVLNHFVDVQGAERRTEHHICPGLIASPSADGDYQLGPGA